MKSNFSQTGSQIFHKTEINIFIVFFTTDLCNNYTNRLKTFFAFSVLKSEQTFFSDCVIITQSGFLNNLSVFLNQVKYFLFKFINYGGFG